jgi:hypothetical protein
MTTPQRLHDGSFPAPPVSESRLLVPIPSWQEMYDECKTTGVEYEEFWDESVGAEVAYFFRWMGEPRSTVLVVWDGFGVLHVESRTNRDMPVSVEEGRLIEQEVRAVFKGSARSPRH